MVAKVTSSLQGVVSPRKLTRTKKQVSAPDLMEHITPTSSKKTETLFSMSSDEFAERLTKIEHQLFSGNYFLVTHRNSLQFL